MLTGCLLLVPYDEFDKGHPHLKANETPRDKGEIYRRTPVSKQNLLKLRRQNCTVHLGSYHPF